MDPVFFIEFKLISEQDKKSGEEKDNCSLQISNI